MYKRNKLGHTNLVQSFRIWKSQKFMQFIGMFVSTSAKVEVDSHHPKSEIIGFLKKIYFSLIISI